MALPDIKVCCVCNTNSELLYFHFTSRYVVVQAYVKPGICTYFNYYDDGNQRVMSAFDAQNRLVYHEAFIPNSEQCHMIGDGSTRANNEFPPRECTTIPI